MSNPASSVRRLLVGSGALSFTRRLYAGRGGLTRPFVRPFVKPNYRVQPSTICTTAATDKIMATNQSGFFLVTVQMEAVAMATVK